MILSSGRHIKPKLVYESGKRYILATTHLERHPRAFGFFAKIRTGTRHNCQINYIIVITTFIMVIVIINIVIIIMLFISHMKNRMDSVRQAG